MYSYALGAEYIARHTVFIGGIPFAPLGSGRGGGVKGGPGFLFSFHSCLHTDKFVGYNNQTQNSLLALETLERKEKAWSPKLPTIMMSFARGCWNFCG